jgi:hypothetical protein
MYFLGWLLKKKLQAPAKLEIEVTNLAAKAGKGIY